MSSVISGKNHGALVGPAARDPAAVARTQLASERLKRPHSGIKRRSNDAQTL